MVATPLSYLADVVAGVAQAAIARYQDKSAKRATAILHKKIITSFIQHFVYFAINLSLPSIAGLSLSTPTLLATDRYWKEKILLSLKMTGCTTLILGPMWAMMGYCLAQQSVGKLPSWARFEGYSIFINGGSLDPLGLRYTDSDYVEVLYQDYKRAKEQHADAVLPTQQPLSAKAYIQFAWSDFLKESTNAQEMQKLTFKTGGGGYNAFKQALIKGSLPNTLLGVGSKYLV